MKILKHSLTFFGLIVCLSLHAHRVDTEHQTIYIDGPVKQKQYFVEINEGSTIASIKRSLFIKYNIAVNDQVIFYGGQLLNDNALVKEVFNRKINSPNKRLQVITKSWFSQGAPVAEQKSLSV